MAKSTRGKSKKAQKPVIAEEIVENATDAVVEDATEIVVEDAEVISDAIESVEESIEHTDPVEVFEPEGIDPVETEVEPIETEAEIEDTIAAAVAPDVVRETVVERKGGFFPMLLGGVVAAGIGVASAEYIFPDGLPFGQKAASQVDLASALKLQEGRIEELTAQIATLEAVEAPTFDTAPLDAAIASVGELQGQVGTLSDSLGALDTRIVTLEELPREDGSGISTAMQNEIAELRTTVEAFPSSDLDAVEAELTDLRAALDLQKGELAQMIDEAQSTKQSAEDTARRTKASAAATQILVALESGAPFEDAIAEIQANSDIALPDALTQSATDGVPTLASLGEGYPDAARAALAAVRSEDTGGGVASFFAKQLGARSVAPREGDDPDAVLSRVGAAVGEGRIEDALTLTDALPEAAKAPLADWISQANTRLSAAREAQALANSLNSQ